MTQKFYKPSSFQYGQPGVTLEWKYFRFCMISIFFALGHEIIQAKTQNNKELGFCFSNAFILWKYLNIGQYTAKQDCTPNFNDLQSINYGLTTAQNWLQKLTYVKNIINYSLWFKRLYLSSNNYKDYIFPDIFELIIKVSSSVIEFDQNIIERIIN